MLASAAAPRSQGRCQTPMARVHAHVVSRDITQLRSVQAAKRSMPVRWARAQRRRTSAINRRSARRQRANTDVSVATLTPAVGENCRETDVAKAEMARLTTPGA